MRKVLSAALALVLTLCLGLMGCRGVGTTDPAKKFIGAWKLVRLESNGEVYSEDEIAMLGVLGLTATLQLNADKTAVFDYGEALTGKWEIIGDSEGTITIRDSTIIMILADERLSLEAYGDKLILAQVDSISRESEFPGNDNSYSSGRQHAQAPVTYPVVNMLCQTQKRPMRTLVVLIH